MNAKRLQEGNVLTKLINQHKPRPETPYKEVIHVIAKPLAPLVILTNPAEKAALASAPL